MNKLLPAIALLACMPATASLASDAAPASQSAANPITSYSTAKTPLGTLLDDPAAKAVVAKYLADLVASPRIAPARGMTLKSLQTFASDTITDTALAEIDADLAKLPPKK